jgi:hypothetical protein
MKFLLLLALMVTSLSAIATTAEYSDDQTSWYPIEVYTSFDWERCVAGAQTGCEYKEPMKSHVILFEDPPIVEPTYIRVAGGSTPDPVDPDPVDPVDPVDPDPVDPFPEPTHGISRQAQTGLLNQMDNMAKGTVPRDVNTSFTNFLDDAENKQKVIDSIREDLIELNDRRQADPK